MPQKAKFTLNDIDVDVSTIGENISKIRKSKGMTQIELAEKIGISQIMVSHFELGKRKLTAEMLIHFAIALGVSADKILGLKKDNSTPEPISPSLLKKIIEIEKLSEHEKRAIIKNIDLALKGAQK